MVGEAGRVPARELQRAAESTPDARFPTESMCLNLHTSPPRPAAPRPRPLPDIRLRRVLREVALRLFCDLQHEAWYEVRPVHRTPWFVWLLRDRAGKLVTSCGVGRHRTREAAAAEAERFFGGL